MTSRPELLSALELDGVRTDMEVLYEEVCNILREQPTDRDDVAADGSLVFVRDTVYSGVRAAIYPILSRRDRFDEFGAATIFTRQYRVQIPWDFDLVQINDIVVFTASADPRIVGREYLVRDVVEQTNIAARLLTVQDSSE